MGTGHDQVRAELVGERFEDTNPCIWIESSGIFYDVGETTEKIGDGNGVPERSWKNTDRERKSP